MLGLWINNSLTTDAKHKLKAFKSSYTFKAKYDGATILFVVVKNVLPGTHARFSDIKSDLENMKVSHFKHDTPKANLHILLWMNDISTNGETYS